MELNFGGTGVDHGSGPDGHDGLGGIESSGVFQTRVQNLLMLLDTHIQRNVILLRPSTQRTQPKHRILETLPLQVLSSTPHQIRMTGMSGVPSLEGVDGICALVLELLHELLGSFAPLVQSVVVSNAIEEFDFPTDEVISAFVNFLDVGMSHVDDSKHAGDDFFLAVGVDFGVAENGHDVSHLGGERHGVVRRGFDGRFGVGGTGQGDGDGHGDAMGRAVGFEMLEVGGGRVDILVIGEVERIDEDGVEVKDFQQSSLAHESLERAGPAFANDLEPVQVQIGDEYFGEGFRLGHLGLPLIGGNVQINLLVAVGVGQSGRSQLGCPFQNAIHLQTAEQNIGTLLDLQLVRFQRDLRIERRFIRIIDASEMLQLAALHPGILSFGIPLLQLVHGNIQEDLVKGNALILVPLPHRIPISPIRTNQPHQRDDPAIRKQRGNLPGPPHALRPIGLAERQIPIDPRPQIVPVQTIDVLPIRLDQPILQRRRDGRLPGAAATRHPQRGPLLSQGGVAGGRRQVTGALGLPRRGGRAFDDVGRRGGQGFGAEGAHVDGRGVDEPVAVARFLVDVVIGGGGVRGLRLGRRDLNHRSGGGVGSGVGRCRGSGSPIVPRGNGVRRSRYRGRPLRNGRGVGDVPAARGAGRPAGVGGLGTAAQDEGDGHEDAEADEHGHSFVHFGGAFGFGGGFVGEAAGAPFVHGEGGVSVSCHGWGWVGWVTVLMAKGVANDEAD
mmetsp:Transcript_28426/g.59660  ORF Transcript_28426/g.59660 Transcript_28426/m.59660 type:complete len:725 (-) Transcript_28426:86-2260(-)